MMEFISVILLVMFIECVIEAVKPIWTKGKGLSVTEYVSLIIGVMVAVVCKINMLKWFMEPSWPMWMEYVFYAMTGVAMGRGTNFIYDMWKRMQQVSETGELEVEFAEDIDSLDLSRWTLDELTAFASANGFELPNILPADEEDAKTAVIQYMFGHK